MRPPVPGPSLCAAPALAKQISGVPVFAKGASFVPLDAFDARVSDARLRRILQSALDANYNTIRVWGGEVHLGEEWWRGRQTGSQAWPMQSCSLSGAFCPALLLQQMTGLCRLSRSGWRSPAPSYSLLLPLALALSSSVSRALSLDLSFPTRHPTPLPAFRWRLPARQLLGHVRRNGHSDLAGFSVCNSAVSPQHGLCRQCCRRGVVSGAPPHWSPLYVDRCGAIPLSSYINLLPRVTRCQ